MSEAKKPRTQAEISREFTQLCIKAGQLVYTLHNAQKDLDTTIAVMGDLNLEEVARARKAAEIEAAIKEKEAAAKAAEPAPDNVVSISQPTGGEGEQSK